MMTRLLVPILLILLGLFTSRPTPLAPIRQGPLLPEEALKTVRVSAGFHVELVAAEPDIVDPVAMAFDEDGRLYVAEMRGYPNGGIGEGPPVLPGRIKRLEDRDGDGRYETASVFVDNLLFPTAVAIWKGGVLVGNAPDLLYCRDTNADGKADKRTILYTGFGTKNIQQLLNSFQFHHDNWFYGCNGNNESIIISTEPDSKPEPPLLFPRTELRGRHFRFKPHSPGSLEPTSGGGQYGLTADDAGNWFTSTNSQHLRHIILPDHYLARNPYLSVPAVALDIPDGVDDHGPAAKVFRISPLEPWRVERTRRRSGSDDRNRFPGTELVPGGYMTSACSPLVYRGGAFPPEYHGDVFVCDPANNLIHRDILEPDGPTFRARRGDKESEFLASTDIWFRPVFLCLGPDGAIYVADFYREIIETPLSLPEDIQKRYNLQSRERGRIWRIVYNKAPKSPALKLSKASNVELVDHLKSPNAWRRLTAQRLLIDRMPFQEEEVIQRLNRLVTASPKEVAEITRLQALCTLDGLHGPVSAKMAALADVSPLVRKEAVRILEGDLRYLCEMRQGRQEKNNFATWETIFRRMLALTKDPSPRVRFQLAFSLGEMGVGPEAPQALMELARKDGANVWHQTAILSSSLPHAAIMLEELLKADDIPMSFLARLAEMAAARLNDVEAFLPKLLANERSSVRLWAVLGGIANGLEQQGRTLWSISERRPVLHRKLDRIVIHARKTTLDPQARIPDRKIALRFLGHVSWKELAPTVNDLLNPQPPQEMQLAAVQALVARREVESGRLLLSRWAAFSPAVRREAMEVLFARPERLALLLSALEQGTIPPAQIEVTRRDLLRRHPHKEIRERAVKVLTAAASNRGQIVAEHSRALKLPVDASRGQGTFRKHCSTCHRLEEHGFTVGPELQSTLKTKTSEMLLLDILDPNREVDGRFVNYVLETKGGRLVTGILVAESASSVTLRRAEGAEDTILRSDIETLHGSGQSLMPEEFEKQLTHQELADLIAYLRDRGQRK